MGKTLRVIIKEKFDSVAYRYDWLNRILRNLNKAISPFTAFRLRTSGILHLRLGSGLRFKLATNETSAVAKKIFWNKPDHYEYTLVFEKLAKKCTVFADIGANIGYYSLIAAKANPTMKVYAFEPAAGPLHFLKKNIAINHLEGQITDFAVALSNRAGNLEFQEIQNTGHQDARFNLGGAGKILRDTDSRRNMIPVFVPAETTDVFFQTLSPLPDLIKMDTEGTENMILEGAENLIRDHRPIIICETLFHVIEPELDRIMRSHGYHFYNFLNGKLARTATLLRTADNGVSDCFFIPPEKEHLIKEFL